MSFFTFILDFFSAYDCVFYCFGLLLFPIGKMGFRTFNNERVGKANRSSAIKIEYAMRLRFLKTLCVLFHMLW